MVSCMSWAGGLGACIVSGEFKHSACEKDREHAWQPANQQPPARMRTEKYATVTLDLGLVYKGVRSLDHLNCNSSLN